MDFKQLEYIFAISREKSISKASEKLQVSRSALNHSLLNLEAELRVSLFQRVNNSMILTYAGKVFLEDAQEILVETRQLRRSLSNMVSEETGTLRIGTSYHRAQTLVVSTLPKFYVKWPEYTVEVITDSSWNIHKKLQEGEIDLAWGAYTGEMDGLEHQAVSNRELMLVVSKNHPVLGKRPNYSTLSLREVAEEPFLIQENTSMSRSIEKVYFREEGVRPNILLECASQQILEDLVSQGVGLSFFPVHANSETEHPDWMFFHLPNPRQLYLGFSYRKNTYFTHADKDFMELIAKGSQE